MTTITIKRPTPDGWKETTFTDSDLKGKTIRSECLYCGEIHEHILTGANFDVLCPILHERYDALAEGNATIEGVKL